MPRQQLRLSQEADRILTDLADELGIPKRAAVEVLMRFYRSAPTEREAIVMRCAVPKQRTTLSGPVSMRLSDYAVSVLERAREALGCSPSLALETLLFDVARANYDTPFESILLKRRWPHP